MQASQLCKASGTGEQQITKALVTAAKRPQMRKSQGLALSHVLSACWIPDMQHNSKTSSSSVRDTCEVVSNPVLRQSLYCRHGVWRSIVQLLAWVSWTVMLVWTWDVLVCGAVAGSCECEVCECVLQQKSEKRNCKPLTVHTVLRKLVSDCVSLSNVLLMQIYCQHALWQFS